MPEKSLQVIRAKELRANMPPMERKFWRKINYDKLGVKFRRQQRIGPYFVDFICFELKLIIELDGFQHFTDEAIKYDNERTDFITAQGYKLIRIPNALVNHHIDGLMNCLREVINGNIDAYEIFKSKYSL
ncbi:MAG: DUF559 domain-containing protein [Rickettsiales bacterium]|jgi:very-short-patch-repair endonuclease|nr:DUF559 domain-containing protein [Rickettsiales bacterium]